MEKPKKCLQSNSVHQEVNNDFLLFFNPLDLNGLHTNCFRCSAITVGCFGFHEPAPPTWERGLPINLLLLGPAGVPSTAARGVSFDCPPNGDCGLDVRHTLCGSHTKDCRPITRSFLSRADALLLSGVVMFEDDDGSGRNVAMEARLLGWIGWVDACWGLTAIEPLLGFNNDIPLVEAVDVLVEFSLSSLETGRREALGLRAGTGDDWGIKLEILLSGILNFVGGSGGFFSALVFCTSFIDDKAEGWVETAAKALVSCFCLAFLSSASWFSKSLTCAEK